MLQWRALFLLALAALGRASPLPAQPPAPKADEIYRLPNDVVPSRYEIHLSPGYVGNRIHGITKFEGTVKITATITKDTERILLHSNEKINVEEIHVFKLNDDEDITEDNESPEEPGNTVEPGNAEEELGTQDPIRWEVDILEIPLDNKIENDNTEIRIEIKYNRNFDVGDLTGFYISNYTFGEDNEKATVLSTQFESTHAREAFPCFDEPGLKAVFDLSIDVTDEVEAIANTPFRPTSSLNSKDSNVRYFETTPKMSTYLLAFVVYETESFDGVHEGVFGAYGRKEEIVAGQGDLSFSDVPWMLQNLGDYTGVYYFGERNEQNTSMGMTKMDQVGIPDYLVGAMENWGLVTYRESALYFPEDGSTAAKKRISEVIAHEVAHHWFGNWVTTKWWNTTWLNEGFANLFQYHVMIDRYEDWRMEERMVLDEQMPAFEADSSANSPPLNHEVNTPQEISDHFGTVTYSKGGSVMRQIRNVLGPDRFKAAVQAYLKKQAFAAATPDDLFPHFIDNNEPEETRLNDEELDAVLRSWTEKPGYPIVTVERDGNKIKVKQDRYLLPNNVASTKYIYDVYLSWVTSLDATPKDPRKPQYWLKTEDDEIDIDGNWEWIIMNSYQGGFYRVDYDTSLWDKLSQVLSTPSTLKKISNIDRAGLINNALSLTLEDSERVMTYEKVFQFLNFLKHDTDFEPWAALRSSIAHVERLVGDTSDYRTFINNIVKTAYENVKFEVPQDEDADANVQKSHRINVLTVACAAKRNECLSDAETQLKNYLTDDEQESKPVHQDLQSVVYCYGLKNAPELWSKLWGKFKEAHRDTTRRQLIVNALGCVNNEEQLRAYLDLTLQDDIIYHEKFLVFTAVYSNPDGGPKVTLKFLQEKGVAQLTQAYGQRRMGGILNGLAQRLTDEADISTFKGLLNNEYAGAVLTAEANQKWKEKNEVNALSGLRRANGATTIALASAVALLCAALHGLFR